MTFVSYAQNFEDVLLWRALGDLPTGFYIDVGASHPDSDSVTRAFYDRGWHGINIEPTDAAYRRLLAARPRDVNLPLALGNSTGPRTFYTLDSAHSGLSTLDPGAVARYAELGLTVQQATVAGSTLAEVCRDHAPADIHFLKIDVEGAEQDVLEGADFARFRPWIVLAEATAPMSTVETHAAWEPILLRAGYTFAWFDGLNRFYVADEHRARLLPHFRTPPNVFDDFVRVADTEYARRLAEAEARADVHAANAAASEHRADALGNRAAAAELRADIAEDRAESAALRLVRAVAEGIGLRDATALRAERLAWLEREIEDAAAEKAHAIRVANDAMARANAADQVRDQAITWLDAIQGSTSWRITSPLRRLLGGAPVKLDNEPPPAAPDPAPPQRPDTRPAPAPPHRAVHQFHSGTATGDAITNAMFLTRRLLRGLGYDSRIFAQHRDPGLGDEVHSLDDLPQHGNYVLLLRHSMGHDALDRVLALPAPKVLIYHNITPPDLLEGAPFLQRYAALGRQQLAAIRPAVISALADSEYNALELRQAGFPAVATCPMLFDLDAMLASSPVSGRGPAFTNPVFTNPVFTNPVFTILFVGRVAPSKGQLELVEAYARFRTAYPRDSRLFLVGRAEDGPYVQALLALIRRLGLADGPVEVTGLVSDAELRRHYAAADLYVSASQHEGFGVPLVEAIAHGIPVLAAASGAVPYTLGPDPRGLAGASPAALAAGMLALANDPAARMDLLAHQHAGLTRFRLQQQVPALTLALVQAGAARPTDPAARAALADNARFTVMGHVNGTYSLAEINRALALSIDSTRPGSVRLVPVEGTITTDVSRIPSSQRHAITALLGRPPPTTAPEIVISQHYPVFVPPEPGDLPLALFFWEESLLPAATAAVLNEGFRGVLAPTRTVAKTLIDSGVTLPVRVVGYAPRLEPFQQLRAQRAARRHAGPFTFLHISSCFPRKGVDVLLAAYARAFRAGDDVLLVIKGFPNPHNTVAADLARLRAADPGLAPIQLIDEDITEPALLALFTAADTVVLPTRGEGYNLPAAEALAAGIPVITTAWGGHMDFVADAPPGAVRLLRFHFAPSATHLATPFSLWAEPDADDLVDALHEAVARGRLPPFEHAPAPADLATPIADFAANLLLAPPAPPPRIGWITTWDVRCGIAEYSRHLVGAVPGPALVLADERTTEAPTVDPSWRVGDKDSLAGLASAILRHDPEALVLQHQPGLVPWTALPALLEHPALHGRVCCVTLHNAQDLADAPAEVRATLVRSLGRMSRVAVHSVRDLNTLAGIGLSANTVLIPHGAAPPAPSNPPRALTPDDAVLLGCYGFFLPGKGIPQLIGALTVLRRTWPKATLRLVNAEYPLPQSADEIAACRALVAEAGLQDAVAFETAFLEHDQSAALLSPCDVLILPYQQSKEGSSAALRSALQSGPPVATTPLPLFDEAGPARIVLPGSAPALIAAGIDHALRDRPARAAAVTAAQAWLAERSWGAVGQRWGAMLHALAASGVVVEPSAPP